MALCRDGKIKAIDNLIDGFEQTPTALHDMLAGKYTGQGDGALRGGRKMSIEKIEAANRVRLSLGRQSGRTGRHDGARHGDQPSDLGLAGTRARRPLPVIAL